MTELTIKIDGSPSIIIGDKGGDFWVGTKSVFNKDPKINRTDADIERNHGHSPGLVEKLQYALKYCRNLGIDGIVQGDFLYTKPDLSRTTIQGNRMIVFTPNTITYAVPTATPLGQRVAASQMGIVFHTYYTGTDLQNMTAHFGYSCKGLRPSTQVFYMDATLPDLTSKFDLTGEEETIINYALKLSKEIAANRDASAFLAMVSSDDDWGVVVSTYNNSVVRSGKTPASAQEAVAGLREWIAGYWDRKVASVSTPAAKQRYADLAVWMMKTLSEYQAGAMLAYRGYIALAQAKMVLLKHLNSLNNLGTFLQKNGELIPTNPEGFVAIEDTGKVVKFVDRLTFSAANFQNKG